MSDPAYVDPKVLCELVERRAGLVHAWLDPLLRKSLAAKNAYTFKGRTKTSDDIWSKVQARRNDKEFPKPDFTADQVTDASGFRIVRLFNAEVPESLNELLSLLKTTLPPGERNGRLKDGAVASGVREIEFHTSRRLDDRLSIYSGVKKVVEDHGFALKSRASEGRASSYSSVHVLLECEAGGSCAFSEIQLRSVFEEAWSEISHRLQHAPAKMARAAGIQLAAEDKSISGLWLHLDALKSLTDGCAQYADLINSQLHGLATERAEREPKPLDPAEKSAAQFASYDPTLRKAVGQAYDLRTEATNATGPMERADKFKRAADAFEVALSAFPKGETDEHRRLGDLLLEEIAFCYRFSENQELCSRAEKIYRQLLVAWPRRVSVLLRLGQLRRDAGDFAEAKQLMELGLAAAAEKPDTDPETQRQANWLLRRDLAYVCWSMVDLDPARADAAPLLRHAIVLSEAALGYAKSEAQDLNTRQNLLYYRVELWTRAPAEEKGELAAKGAELLAGLRSKVDLEGWPIERLDTIVRGEAAFGDHERAVAAAKVVSRTLATRISGIRKQLNCSHAQAFGSLSRDEQDMYLCAQDILSGSSGQG